ncbi:MAG: multidrug transporter substrate-binding protein [Rickettsiales bacterium]|jgi:lipoprotein-releasing system permease protein|nr:multidrug transporter substrate-binding protein [Rickettsiales bacterium]
MIAPFEWMIAFRYLRARRKEGFISVIALFSLLGIALGVATLIVVMSVMNGFRQELLSRILGINSHVTIAAFGAQGISDYDKLAESVRKISDVTMVSPLVEGQVMITSGAASAGGMVKGMRYDDILMKDVIAHNIRGGDMTRLQQGNYVMLGQHLADNLGVEIGDTITLISASNSRSTVLGSVPRMKKYIVAALFEAGMYEYDSTTLFMPLDSAQKYFGYPNTVSGLEVMVRNGDHTAAVTDQIINLTKGEKRVTDWKQANSSYFNALDVERSVMFLILTLIILVAAFNIISSLIMLVNDKQRSIAIIRTMGAGRGSVLRIFLICGASVGVVGTLLGGLLGVSFAANIKSIQKLVESLTGTRVFDPVIYFLSELPAVINPVEVMTVLGMALSLSFLATLYPSWKAARCNPAEALRYE